MELKQRDADYCNLKFVLIFLVVYGHLIEGRLEESAFLTQMYCLIYTVHMPLFLFLSGFFMKGEARCRQQMKQMLLYYIVLQGAIVLWAALFSRGEYSVFVPVWHLWYLLSLGCMAAAGWLWYRFVRRFPKADKWAVKIGVLLFAVFFACMAGDMPFIGRFLSLSRTIVFLPYFLGGLFCPDHVSWREYRFAGIAALVWFGLLYCAVGRYIPVDFFYQADPYDDGLFILGAFCRLLCCFMGGSLGLFLLSFTTCRRVWFSKIGTDTLAVYLLHAPMVKLFDKVKLPIRLFIYASPFLAFYIIYFLYRASRWTGQMYAIRQTGRRHGSV